MRRLVLLFDGTWNTRETRTNVQVFDELLAKVGPDGTEQKPCYIQGVGTSWDSRLTGGAFGRGLSQNIWQGYEWLCENHRQDDEVFVFGFSRGAYSARSLVGFVRKCGLLRECDPKMVRHAYRTLYRDRVIDPKNWVAEEFRRKHARADETPFHFVGVWDTVGALGVPVTGVPVPFGQDAYQWHDTQLSRIVRHAFHAVAIDEHRKDYNATLWTGYTPAKTDTVEQRWFVGAHANVGGGYKDDPLRDVPLRWMQQKAAGCGLAFKSLAEVRARPRKEDVRDSYREFMKGIYRWWKGGEEGRHYRTFGVGVCETVDESVWELYRSDPSYRPRALRHLTPPA
ncbi:MAG TPA: DUF2235 domain-containing protein [Tepidisphaeraceae bacterium]|nr:DUF2235 domain-containing protein [Tepidisphaeraceae bacterium]